MHPIRIHLLRLVCLAAAAGCSGPVLAQSSAETPLEQRVQRLERILDSGGLLQLMDEVELLRKEVQELRGQVELQSHTLSQLKGQQRDLYLDLDRRLQRVERAGTRPAGAEPSTPEATASASPSASASASSAGAASSGAAAPEPSAPQSGGPDSGASESSASESSASESGASDSGAPDSGAPEPGVQTARATPSPAETADPVAEQKAYTEAFNLLKAGRYGEAVEAFNSFLQEYPSGKYADNAQYWLGEAYYVTRQFKAALEEFRKLVNEYPSSQKISHGLLKIGYIHDELGDTEEAQRVLSDLMARYPDTTAARLARERLQRIRSETG